jgi:hypothetical protein
LISYAGVVRGFTYDLMRYYNKMMVVDGDATRSLFNFTRSTSRRAGAWSGDREHAIARGGSCSLI